MTDAAAMSRALTLAERGWGRVHPNPLVGAVLLRDGAVVGEGWHAEYGERHAETVALAEAGELARGATLFVTLEPCNHQGKQPPCVKAILAAGVARVVVAQADPNPTARGGIEHLRGAGVAVEVGLLEDAARRLNARFLHRYSGRARPFVAIKLAVSLDGRIADAAGRSQWISGPEARDYVHHLRAGFAAIGIGGRTLVADDARLTVRGRLTPREAPIRVVFDRSGVVPPTQGIFEGAADVPVWLVAGGAVPAMQTAAIAMRGAQVLVEDSLALALDLLGARDVDSLLIEGGGRLAGALLAGGLVDRVYQIQCPVWLGEGRDAWSGLGTDDIRDALRWHTVERRALGDDTLLVLEQ
ncbi:MAG: bifunctional diaminohydroxyphosphoribosylaminopyrimidine deaminase/5-amino-6-(5-phosphoribosylamino)uracil reductase RibD [Gemmatimonadales bacterium]